MEIGPFAGIIYTVILIVDCLFFLILEWSMPREDLDFVQMHWDQERFVKVCINAFHRDSNSKPASSPPPPPASLPNGSPKSHYRVPDNAVTNPISIKMATSPHTCQFVLPLLLKQALHVASAVG